MVVLLNVKVFGNFNFLAINFFVGLDEPISFKQLDISDWLSTAQRSTLDVIKLFNQQFYVPFPIKDSTVPSAIDKPNVTDLSQDFNFRFLPLSPLERHWPGLTTLTTCTTNTP